MNWRAIVVLGLLITSVILVPSLGLGQEKDATARRIIPGLGDDGAILLHNQWKLRPVGAQVELGDLRENAEYQAAKERQRYVLGRMAEVVDRATQNVDDGGWSLMATAA